MSTRAAVRAGLVRAMWLLLLAAFVGSLALQGNPRNLFADGLGLLAVWTSAGVCWLAVSQVGFRRGEVLLSAAAVTSFAAGRVSPADVGSLLFYPLILAAMFVAVRRHSQGLASSMWLDSAVGSLGAASVLAVILSPVLDSALNVSPWPGTVLAVDYPMLDLLLIATVIGITARGVPMGHRWGLLGVGLTAFAASDIVLALQRSDGIFTAGSALDAGWGIGLALVAMWVDGTAHFDGSTTHEALPAAGRALAVSSVATVAGLGVLVAGLRGHLPALALVLAVVTLLAATVRSHLACRQLAAMADLRRQAAATDELTGLPNRRALYAEGPARLLRPRHGRQALLMLDLNNFKEVNDSLGHHAGDQLLIRVGARLQEVLPAGDLLARLGGDEFAVLMEGAGPDEAEDAADTLRATLAEPFNLEDISLHTSATIGIALFPDHGADLSTLLRKADIAMYKAKGSGRGQHVYSGVEDADDTTRLQTVQELRRALAGDQLVLHYQPKIDLDTSEVHGVEALVRWNHPTRSLLHPDAFLSLVEESGLMPLLTRVVLTQALDQIARWHSAGQHLTVAVNLSASSLVDSDLPQQIVSMLAARGLSPQALQLEITEELMMTDRDRARAVLTRLRDSGVQISVDDFGTGYSSLSYLRDLPIDELKLDRSFIVPQAAENDRSTALVASTIDMAHSLGLRMVAEGVETDAAYAELARLGCDQAQGFYMSRPVPAGELDQWLSNRGTAYPLKDTARTRSPAAKG